LGRHAPIGTTCSSGVSESGEWVSGGGGGGRRGRGEGGGGREGEGEGGREAGMQVSGIHL